MFRLAESNSRKKLYSIRAMQSDKEISILQISVLKIFKKNLKIKYFNNSCKKICAKMRNQEFFRFSCAFLGTSESRKQPSKSNSLLCYAFVVNYVYTRHYKIKPELLSEEIKSLSSNHPFSKTNLLALLMK